MRLAFFFVAFLWAVAAAAGDAEAAWTALSGGGHVALVRHGNAPPGYGGDPPGFKIDDCATQRNLDEQGRAEARTLGAALRKRAVKVDRVLSSPWCRCLDTAQLMEVGAVEKSWAAAASEKSPARMAELNALIADWRGPGTLVVVTHAITIRAVTGVMPAQAEVVVIKPGAGAPAVVPVGRIAAP